MKTILVTEKKAYSISGTGPAADHQVGHEGFDKPIVIPGSYGITADDLTLVIRPEGPPPEMDAKAAEMISSQFDLDKFIDFWEYLDPQNPCHQEALKLLYAQISPYQLNDASPWVQKYREVWEQPDPPAGMSQAADEAATSTTPFDPSAPIDWNQMGAKVSQYFTVREVTNSDRRRIPRDSGTKGRIRRMALELDKVRDAWDGPLIVTSWHRPPAINRAVGGARYSQHIQGHGVDIKPAVGSVSDFQAWIDSKWGDALGYGAWKGFVHLDMRGGIGFNGQKGNVRWNY